MEGDRRQRWMLWLGLALIVAFVITRGLNGYGNPRSWQKALHGVESTGGMVIDVTDEEIGEAKAAIGRDGIGCEPASATTLAGLKKLREANVVERDAEVVAMLTGHGLKDTAYILERHGAGSQGQQEGH